MCYARRVVLPTLAAGLVAGLLWYGLATGQDKKPAAVPVVNQTQFQQAMQLSRLATDKGMPALALKAFSDSLAGGPPVMVQVQEDGRRMAKMAGGGPGTDNAQMFPLVEWNVASLESAWRSKKLPPDQVYEALASAVLPPARPAEIFTYPAQLAAGVIQQPRSVGKLLVRWAVVANKADDLKKRIEARQEQPLAQLPARVLLAQLGEATKDAELTNTALTWLGERIAKENVQFSAELCCHAAMPLLYRPDHSQPALKVLETALKSLGNANNPQMNDAGSNLRLALARFYFDRKNFDAGKKEIQDYLRAFEAAGIRYGGDYGVYQRKLTFQRVAFEYARAGQFAEAMDLMGQFADGPRYSGGDPPVSGVIRMLAQQLASKPAQERYELLKAWTLPTANRKSVRLLATFVPMDSPPASMATTPKLRTPGLASTSDMLLAAAQETNKLNELVAELRPLVEQKVENARALLIVTLLAAGMSEQAEPLAKQFTTDRRNERKAFTQEQSQGRRQQQREVIEWPDYAVCRACLADAKLRGLGVEMTSDLVDQAKRTQNHVHLSHLRHDVGVAQGQKHGVQLVPGADPGLDLWHPGAREPTMTHQAGSVPAWWFEHDGFVCHNAGQDWNFLHFAYPLTGTFSFAVDCYAGGWAEGNVSYGGLGFDALHMGQGASVWSVAATDRLQRAHDFTEREAYNRVTVEVEPGKHRVLVNGRLFYEETKPAVTSPFLAVYSSRERQTAFRNFTLTGTPEIPREVKLLNEDSFEGWQANFYGESTPPRFTKGQQYQQDYGQSQYGVTYTTYGGPGGYPGQRPTGEIDPESYDWHSKAGVLIGKRGETSVTGDPVQSRIFYHRPLRDGESIRYEFLYEPDATHVHPALDRLAFLLEPGGVRLHWMTDGDDNEWSGLKVDNVFDEPAMRRGPEKLPLKPGDWNTVKLGLKNQQVKLELNGILVCERPIEAENNRTFGLFRYRDRTAARVRNAVLAGDWPTKLSADQMANLLKTSTPVANPAEPKAKHDVLDPALVAGATPDVLDHVKGLTPVERYAYLRAWVLPSAQRSAWRVHATVTPTDSAPPIAKKLGMAAPSEPRSHLGGQIVSPVLELVRAAQEAGKLDEIRQAVQQAPAEDDHAQRCQLAILALVEASLNQNEPAKGRLQQLLDRLPKMPETTPELERWPELLAAAGVMEKPGLLTIAMQLLDFVVTKQIQKNGTTMPKRAGWERQVRHLRSRAQVLALGSQAKPFGADPGLRYWSAVTHATANSRGVGDPIPDWRLVSGELRHYVGHARDYLYFNVPLRGNFEVTCELTSFGWREAQIGYGGARVALFHDLKQIQLESFNRSRFLPLQPPIDKVATWYPFRLVVKDGLYEAYVGDRKVHEDRLPAEPDPWLMIHSHSGNSGGARKLAINGEPSVPRVLNLTKGLDLTGWLADYYGQSTTGENPNWSKRGDEVMGQWVRQQVYNEEGYPVDEPTPQQETLLKHQESLLQYHRPLLEDGVLEYEFYYEPKKTHVHPAMDRLVFLLESAGVRIHWLTDKAHDRTGLLPDNVTDEPAHRKGPSPLPLKEKAWNKLKLTLAGDVVTLALNGVDVYQRPLESTNQRTFGLFHCNDQHGVRVRNVTHQGQWPEKVPSNEDLISKK